MGLDDEAVARLVRHKTDVFNRLVEEETSIISGVPEFVGMLRANGIPLAVCSGGTQSDIALMLKGTVLEGVFDPIVAADDVRRGKPHPEGFQLALSLLNERADEPIECGQCVAVEDSRWGLQAAASAGMHTVAVTNTYDAEHLRECAEMVVERLDTISLADLQAICE